MPRILPLVGIALGGVLAINALAGARDLPGMLSGARAWAEDAAAPTKPVKKSAAKKPADAKAADPAAAAPAAVPAAPAIPGGAVAPTGSATDAAATAGLPPPTIQPKGVCAPTAAELAKEAGLSPAELQVLQNLGARRGQLDQREADLSTQLALLAAAEAKLDAKAKVLTALKSDIQGLLTQADGREQAEVDRLVKVYEGMKPKDAAARMAILEDGVRLPIAAKMKERSLSAIVGQMPPQDAKKLTESLAHRFAAAQTLAQNAQAQADAVASKTAAADDPAKAAPAKAKPVRAAKKAPPRKKAPDDATAAADKPADKPAAAEPAAPPPAKAG
ncbi:MotE family protein [Phenylobacterium sp.]|jgi:flagellar motility protein MotE (MotC chaperone)|uniref:MotE family protein n=1 Tax=Phenylobacterium sp. TaxID=1871053 RepID=UPI002E2EF224|nr:MotE family protein [Phenylobacterium sp.]HEX3364324.1 MotE family protein [Phenylobacterium sp.]